MNCEHNYYSCDYEIIFIKKLKDKKNQCLYTMNGKELIASPQMLKRQIDTIEYFIQVSDLVGEVLYDIDIIDNKILLSFKTRDGVRYSTNIQGHLQRIKCRFNFEIKVMANNCYLIDTYINAKCHVKIDHRCGHEYHSVTPNSYVTKNASCPICSHQKIVPFINDCYTLRQDVANLLVDYNEAIGISISDKQRRFFKCPTCGSIRENTISNISSFGFSCYVCGDGISYPEKVMMNILDSIGNKYEIYKRFDWCTYQINGISYKGEYDFVLSDKKIIIEMDGAFHSGNGGYNGIDVDLNKQKDFNKDQLAISHGYNIIRVDCNYKNNTKRFLYIKESILKKLSNILCLENIDWNEIDMKSSISRLKESCDLWNSGMATDEIAEALKTNRTSVIEYLKRGNNLGMCIYSKKISNLRQAKMISSKLYKYTKAIDYKSKRIIGVFYDVDNFIYNYFSIYNKKLKKQRIREIAENNITSFGNVKLMNGANNSLLTFELISKDEYELLVKDKDLINDIVQSDYPIVCSNTNYTDLWEELQNEKNSIS